MSIGRPDYNQKVIPIPIEIGDNQDPYYVAANLTSNVNSESVYIEFIIPSNYDLFITYFRITSNTPNRAGLFIKYGNISALLNCYFEGLYEFKGEAPISIYVPAGQTLLVQVTNYEVDGFSSNYNFMMRGYKQYVE